MTPKIVFEDTHLIVLSKPAGLLSQGEKTGDVNLVDWLRQYLGRPYVGLVHRLDRNTSGLLVVAKRTKSANRLTQALQSGELKRKYLAWLVGDLREAKQWRHWLVKNESTNLVRAYREGERIPSEAKEARLSVKPLEHRVVQGTPVTLAEFELETGRSHQIRAQAAAEGLPLLGDQKYGRPNDPPFSRTALQSYWIEFPHPMSGDVLKFEEPLAEDLRI